MVSSRMMCCNTLDQSLPYPKVLYTHHRAGFGSRLAPTCMLVPLAQPTLV